MERPAVNRPARTDTSFDRLARGTEGLTTVEYIIVLVLIAMLAIGVWRSFGSSVRNQVDTSTTQVDTLGNREH